MGPSRLFTPCQNRRVVCFGDFHLPRFAVSLYSIVVFMKKIFVLLCAAVLLSGCVRYDVTLNNGNKLVSVPKPKYDKEKDAYIINSGGQKTVICSSRIVVIEPHQKKEEVKNTKSK